MRLLRKIVVSFICFFVLLSSYSEVSAIQEFSTQLSARYVVDLTGATTVKQNFTIKNNLSNIYATQYALEVGSTRINTIAVTSLDGQQLPFTSTQTDNKTSITITFPDKVVGKDQARKFIVSYKNLDVAVVSGSVLEVSIPKIADKTQFESYEVSLEVPQKFGEPAIAVPPVFSLSSGQTSRTLSFKANALNGISIIFGDKQIYDLTLRYHLQNPTVSQGVAQVALPPDTPYQRIVYHSIDPKPDSIEPDIDGNWIATFTVGSKKEQTVTAQASVVVYLSPTINVPVVVPNNSIFSAQPYWQADDPKIKQLSDTYRTPRDIYDFLIKTLSYNYDRLNDAKQVRQGAVQALANPTNAVCQEYVDVFVAIARAAGIPTREVNGFAYTQNPKLRPLSLLRDVLHAWPEYYDAKQQQWIPIDPTWAETTGGVDFFSHLDFNHIVFAFHGASSEKPYPAGEYKIEGKEEKDVDVQVSSVMPKDVMKLSMSIQKTPISMLNLSDTVTVLVTNESGSAWYDIPVQVSADVPLHTVGEIGNIDVLLPYQQKVLKIHVAGKSPLTSTKGTLHIHIGNADTTYEVTTGSIIKEYLYTYGKQTAVGVGAIVIAVIAWRVLVSRKKR